MDITTITTITTITNINDINQKLDHFVPAETIIFFDIDNTLLRTTSDIGSVEWIKWQEKMIHEGDVDNQYCVAKNTFELYQYYQTWLKNSNCKTDLIEDHLSEMIDKYAKLGFKIVLVTARNKGTWETTLDQLRKHYNFDNFYANNLLLDTPVNLYNKGVYFATGMDKGKCIKLLLQLYELTFNYVPSHIIFVDDSMDECLKVAKQLGTAVTNQLCTSNINIDTNVYCYRQCVKFENDFNKLDKGNLHKKWTDFCQLFNII